MYLIKAEQSFDSAHFLAGYEGKCSNLHGHRWRVESEICSVELHTEGQLRGMVADFKEIRQDLSVLAEQYDHALIYEEGSLKEKTVEALREENFRLVAVPFRPTAENFARHFYGWLKDLGYAVRSVAVYETPQNCAVYME